MIQVLNVLKAVLPWKTLAKLALADFLKSEKATEQLIDDLRVGAKKTETDYDDAMVDAFEKVWKAAVPILVEKL